MKSKILQNIINQSLDIICSFDKDGHFVWVNDAVINVLGYQPKELLGKHYKHYLISDDLSKTKAASKKIIEGVKSNNFTNRYLSKQGRVVTLHWSAQ